MDKVRYVPRILMQTWKTKDVPDKWKPSQISIRKHMPNYEYHLMTDEDNRNFVIKYFRQYLAQYDGYKYPIQRADLIRYMWMYINGGLYMDLDDELNEDMDTMFDYFDLFFIQSSNVGFSLTNSLMASRAGHPIWLEILEESTKPLPCWCVGKHLEVMWSTGPGLVNRVVQASHYPYVVLPRNKINPYSICDTQYNKKSMITPLEGQSWVGWDTLFMGTCYCNYTWIGVVVIFLIILLVIWLLFRQK